MMVPGLDWHVLVLVWGFRWGFGVILAVLVLAGGWLFQCRFQPFSAKKELLKFKVATKIGRRVGGVGRGPGRLSRSANGRRGGSWRC